MGELVELRGSRLYVEQWNEAGDDALLYLHGGPGASCLDFGYGQGQALAASFRIVALDQRGVLRSDAILPEEDFGVQVILEDLEALREKLGISSWSVLGHSFGGFLAVQYALAYPASIKKIVFEAPSFDAGSSVKGIMAKALERFEEIRDQEGIDLCRTYLKGTYSSRELWEALGPVFRQLGELKDLVYFRGITPAAYSAIIDSFGIPGDYWGKTQTHQQKLIEDERFYENLLPKLSSIKHPTLLITGKHDPVCGAEQQEAYRTQVSGGKLLLFEHSAHFPRLEEPERYTGEVLEFLMNGSCEANES